MVHPAVEVAELAVRLTFTHHLLPIRRDGGPDQPSSSAAGATRACAASIMPARRSAMPLRAASCARRVSGCSTSASTAS